MFQREALSARHAGFDVTIISIADKVSTCPPDHGCRIVELPSSSRIGKVLTVWQVFKKGRREQCDIYHCHDLASLIAGAVLKLVKGSALVYDAHENYPLTHATNIARSRLLRRLLHRVFLVYEWLLAHFADEVFTVDPLIARKFKAMGIKARVLPNFPHLNTEVSKGPPIVDWTGRRVFVYAGGLTRKVAIKQTLAAVDQLRNRYPDVLLALVGSFGADHAYRQEVEQFVSDHGLAGHVSLIDQVPFTFVPEILHHSYAGLLIYDITMPYGDKLLYPVKVTEYMAAGLPIIASSFRGLEALLRRRRCGLTVDPLSPDAIEAAMEQLLSDAALAQKLGQAGKAAFEIRYNWEAVESVLLDAYRRLAAQPVLSRV